MDIDAINYFINNNLADIMIKLNEPITYHSTTNKIVAYLLPEPIYKTRKYEDFNDDLKEWQNSKIETQPVDDELRDFIERYAYFMGENIYDLTSIIDKIDISEKDCNFPACQCTPSKCKEQGYTAKLKQVNIEVSETVSIDKMSDFIQWAFNSGWCYYIELNQWRKSVQYKTTQELYEIFNNKN